MDCFFRTDADFDWIYPEHFQLMSQKQWTPLQVAKSAAGYLNVKGAKILDIGSGIGKFCLTAAHLYPDSHFFGVEQRHELVHYAKIAKNYLRLENISFIHANITQVNFKEFDHFYFYNSFYENIDRENAIDDSIETSYSLYDYYTQYLQSVLKDKPSGTRVVTYQSLGEILPDGYKQIESSHFTLLRLWIKE
ncbi:class I SAM-dependent methyltransferase [Mucilaginibacter mali]|uniref:Class I SAM-dependent methyltransferase n=2 Tax=Mucilaginibacter mali TaxID=2740462 RepID=A0A7D4UMU9_9SPHI|nr:class I SAM-dependent methyltransferase [Mucilaginibacter mali]